jgi:uncharacterized peroxidase-related enzyme
VPTLAADDERADELVHAVATDWRRAALPAREQALCAFAEKLTADQRAMNAEDLDDLRAHGLDDRAIHDAVQVIAYFNYITRIADGLGVDPEPLLQHWGHAHGAGRDADARP